ncbi:polysaccharide biosynthesis/export family protein [Leptobacterium flavescens]|uniref:polysaccharide biosynthesis/export family protein n=1 Tax=Leptobacterium flavescens TaxID=472055 RepID=UPI00293C013D|nr:polysaccharide biosynthesis/export family protein [Leptobacterium flavescens]
MISSCGSRENVVYFQSAKEFETEVNTNTFTPRFKVDDVVAINVSALDLETTRPFNLLAGTGDNAVSLDYLIDKDGFIEFPVLGKVKLLGLTPTEAKDMLREKLSEYIKNPIINLRLNNFQVTVLGEVNRPGTYPVTGERITLLEAIGLAGDLTIQGERKNVLIIRDFNGVKTYSRVDLTTKEFVNSPVYYLTQNDVVYVEPNKGRVRSSGLDSIDTLTISIGSSLVLLLVSILIR